MNPFDLVGSLNGECPYMEGATFLHSNCTTASPYIIDFDIGVVPLIV
jgi:hypothetical protein